MKRTTRTLALIGTAALAMTLAVAAPAVATPAGNKCLVQHSLDQQPVATIVAHAEPPENEACGVGMITLQVWRNDVLVSSQSGWAGLDYEYNCVTTAPTVWRTNWDPARTFNCG
ncbi:hypothetical protein AB0F15_36140 [Amycolatopsis sp. NPDC026612]|uniref:hypothetical protein n=1 Tax=Amycolatopsis sp. NPDC026612 TaxID=3155466 RepID=UPI0033F857A5